MEKVRYGATRPIRYLFYGAAILLGTAIAFLSPAERGKTNSQLISTDAAYADIPYAQGGYVYGGGGGTASGGTAAGGGGAGTGTGTGGTGSGTGGGTGGGGGTG